MVKPIPSPEQLGLSLPSWRPGQVDVLMQALKAIEAGRIPFILAPTGFGKWVLANALARLLNLTAFSI